MHLIEKHASEEKILKKVLKEKHGKITADMRQYILQLSRCNETISDIKAVLKGGISFAQGYEGFSIKEIEEAPRMLFFEINATKDEYPFFVHRYKQALFLKEELTLLAQLGR